jgi:hypothetical protein
LVKHTHRGEALLRLVDEVGDAEDRVRQAHLVKPRSNTGQIKMRRWIILKKSNAGQSKDAWSNTGQTLVKGGTVFNRRLIAEAHRREYWSNTNMVKQRLKMH